ncbi:DUF2878 domain-containing protein [Pseudidiomarina sediminum]|uniref:DUF2878 domain-containing protein n=1 Tax=Pseudidiomarina sediminum TaxID=431675 RepID=UPI001C979191|nr:DUF2878 domain-containing protein [Pseudidiomarina sediminum]MBY6062955.1 DUF2878 domain-containing protein [Pseudidiomarina sediminum]
MLQRLITSPQIRRLTGLFWFDLVWFVAVVGREPWLALAFSVALVQVLFSVRSPQFRWQHYTVLLGLGLALEAVVVASGTLEFDGAGLLPWWLIALWCGFPAMAITTLDWLAGRYWLAALIGIAFGPLTYAAGVRLGAAELLTEEWRMWLLYGVLWALYMVFFAGLMQRKRRVKHA